mgnify:CR=1 FL=1
MPRFFAAFSVLKRVRKLELKNSNPNVLFFPNSIFASGFALISFASLIQVAILSMSFNSESNLNEKELIRIIKINILLFD